MASEVRDAYLRRVNAVPEHGLGLSVDVYSPDLFELVDALQDRGLEFGFLEIFKAATPALVAVRKRLPTARLAYHGDGLWLPHPALDTLFPLEAELNTAVEQARVLGSAWITHEGAAKQLAGYSFGTYLPPLFTPPSADLTAANISLVQDRLDRLSRDAGWSGPLLLVETPPLTYFGFGPMSMAEYFRRITELSPCGLVLDLGHLWTAYRYSGAWRSRSLTDFLEDFLETVPLERVVEIHVAGLAAHASEGSPSRAQETACRVGPPGPEPPWWPDPPWWIDAHGAPIPALLFDMLDQVLAHPGLVHLKGMALEVDTKPVGEILREYGLFCERFGGRMKGKGPAGQPAVGPEKPAAASGDSPVVSLQGPEDLLGQYLRYAQVVTGQAPRLPSGQAQAEPPAPSVVEGPVWDLDPEALARYSERYLPHEILEWGGNLEAMFPDTCRALRAAGLSLEALVGFWFKEARPTSRPYDFFLLKLERFQDFVREVLPPASATAAREATELRKAYQRANEEVGR